MSDPGSSSNVCHLYVDEAGDPSLFDEKGRVKLGMNGCSRFFMIGMLQVADPQRLALELNQLRHKMIASPHFSKLPSFAPKNRKTAEQFHAKDDHRDVRIKVYELLCSFGEELRFRAVVCDKAVIAGQEIAKQQAEEKYRCDKNKIYDQLTEDLITRFTYFADRFELKIAKRGTRERNEAIRGSIIRAESRFQNRFILSRGGPDAWNTVVTNPKETVCLQAVDYYLWALQRFYASVDRRDDKGSIIWEDRYLLTIWPQVSNIYDMHFSNGTYFNKNRPLTIESRFGDLSGA